MHEQLRKYLEPVKPLQSEASGIESRGMILTGIKAVVFDIYGTLLISASGDVGSAASAGSTEAFRHALCAVGLDEYPCELYERMRELFFAAIDETHQKLKAEGLPFPEVDILSVWDRVLSNPVTSGLFPELGELDRGIIAAAYESVVNPVWPMPGMEELLSGLESEGFTLGLISNAQFYTPLIFEYLKEGGLSSFGFSSDLSVFSYKHRRAKPDKHLFEIMLDELGDQGISPSETVYVGNDMLNDIMPAAACGLRTILFAGDGRSLRMRSDHPACKDLDPDVIVNSLTDILNYIQEG